MQKILIVDDDPAMVEFLKSILSAEGYEAAEALDGVNAILQVKSFQPDLVLLDVNMPEINGNQVCRMLRERSRMEPLAIVMLSANDMELDKLNGQAAGANDYLTKPVDREELLATIKCWLPALELE